MIEGEKGAGKMAQGYLLFILTILSAPHYLQMFYLRVYFCGGKGVRGEGGWKQDRIGVRLELEERILRG